ncbi:MAG TPA: hypothetical protein VN605_01855 [Thermoanaerobaculia bacterium]|nr:hypothetical protein [Thermoanaerobaculia bacterium]
MRSLICLFALAAAACATSPYRATTPTRPPLEHAPLPLDPLTDAEAARAQEVVRSDATTRQLLGDNPRLIYVISIAPKLTADGEPRGRHADLLYRRGDNALGVRVLVDIAAGRVIDRSRVVPTSLPIGTADIEEALAIAQSSDELQPLLRSYGSASAFRVLSGPLTRQRANENFVQGLRHIGSGPDDPCRMNLCIYLLFNSGGRQILRGDEILVDLNTRRVMVRRTGGVQ